jgi:hypothetical protein
MDWFSFYFANQKVPNIHLLSAAMLAATTEPAKGCDVSFETPNVGQS